MELEVVGWQSGLLTHCVLEQVTHSWGLSFLICKVEAITPSARLTSRSCKRHMRQSSQKGPAWGRITLEK